MLFSVFQLRWCHFILARAKVKNRTTVVSVLLEMENKMALINNEVIFAQSYFILLVPFFYPFLFDQ